MTAGAEGESGPAAPEDEPPLIRRGNPPRWGSGLALTLGGLLLGVANLLGTYGPRAGVAIGFAAAVVTAVGLLWLLGSFDDDDGSQAVPLQRLAPGLAVTAAGALGTLLGLRLAVAGALGPTAAGALIPLAFLGAVAGVGLTLGALGVFTDGAPFYRREGFWLLCIATLVLLPTLGAHSLFDPWETHYGEVSREILARRDWISLWWVNEEWFWSKPILGFWMQALGMATLGVRYEPGGMLAATQEGSIPYPEWAVRFPFFLVTIGATYVRYKAIASAFGRRAALFAGVCVTTMPQWFLLSRQTMADMPFVAGMSAALGFFLLGAHAQGDARVRSFAVALGGRRLSLSAHQLVLGVVCLIVVPQVIYLLTRNLTLNVDPRFGLRVPPIRAVTDAFTFGSAGNCGVMPGNKACVTAAPVYPKVLPALQALVWAAALGVVLFLEWGERRARRLYFLAAFVCAGVATMGKGPAGLVLPGTAVLGYIVSTKRYRLLLDLELSAGTTAFCAVALPWFVAMWTRHGWPFVDRLIFHDMYKRAFDHVHDTNKSEDVSFRYYVWQLGYATFPWVAWVPAALARAQRDDDGGDEHRARRGTIALLAVWFIVGFALFSYMQTKFHHYIFPAVPALGLLAGLTAHATLDVGAKAATSARSSTTVLAVCGAMLVLLVGRDLALARPDQPSDARLLHLFTYLYERPWPQHLSFSAWFWAFSAAAAACLLATAFERVRRFAVTAFAVVAIAFAGWTLDVYMPRAAPHWGQRELVLSYLQASKDEPGPLVAYQMNWKGENFYTGNQIANFKETGEAFRAWLAARRREGKTTVYVVLLPRRVDALATELGEPKELVRLTTPELNNKFALYRARL